MKRLGFVSSLALALLFGCTESSKADFVTEVTTSAAWNTLISGDNLFRNTTFGGNNGVVANNSAANTFSGGTRHSRTI
jgi:hypothetical protein